MAVAATTPEFPEFIPAEFIAACAGVFSILGFLYFVFFRRGDDPVDGLGLGAGWGGVGGVVIWIWHLLSTLVS